LRSNADRNTRAVSSNAPPKRGPIVSRPEHSSRRFIYLATSTSIHILQFVDKLGAFSTLTEIKTDEPCICICSTSFGFIYGADNFHFVNFGDFSSSTQMAIDDCPSDYPVAALEISANEYLLAFHNYGVFVTASGRRSRRDNIEWEMVPLEFTCVAQHLYIIYRDFLEICKIAPYEGTNSPTLLFDQRSMYKCRCAHYTGVGVRSTEVMFALSSNDRTELHVFNNATRETERSLKRKIADTLNPLNMPANRRKH